jgi:hypothetical protein
LAWNELRGANRLSGVKRILMKSTATLLVSISALALANSAAAAPVVHDAIAKFDSIVAAQGKGTNDSGALVTLPSSTFDLTSMFDGNPATAFTLGLGGTVNSAGGSLNFVIAPTTNLITSGTLLTPGGRKTPTGAIDFAELYLGKGGSEWQKVGKLGNDGSIDTTGGLAGVVLSAVVAETSTSFSLTVLSGTYNSLRFLDVTPAQGANRDGFDIAAFSLTSDLALPNPVPTPATLALAALSLAGLWLVRRRPG